MVGFDPKAPEFTMYTNAINPEATNRSKCDPYTGAIKQYIDFSDFSVYNFAYYFILWIQMFYGTFCIKNYVSWNIRSQILCTPFSIRSHGHKLCITTYRFDNRTSAFF